MCEAHITRLLFGRRHLKLTTKLPSMSVCHRSCMFPFHPVVLAYGCVTRYICAQQMRTLHGRCRHNCISCINLIHQSSNLLNEVFYIVFWDGRSFLTGRLNLSQGTWTESHDCPPGGLAGLFGCLWPHLRSLTVDHCNATVLRSADLVYVCPCLLEGAVIGRGCILCLCRCLGWQNAMLPSM
jgi:hypothetical protein